MCTPQNDWVVFQNCGVGGNTFSRCRGHWNAFYPQFSALFKLKKSRSQAIVPSNQPTHPFPSHNRELQTHHHHVHLLFLLLQLFLPPLPHDHVLLQFFLLTSPHDHLLLLLLLLFTLSRRHREPHHDIRGGRGCDTREVPRLPVTYYPDDVAVVPGLRWTQDTSIDVPLFEGKGLDYPIAIAVDRLCGQHHWGFITEYTLGQYERRSALQLYSEHRPRRPIGVAACCGSSTKVVVLGTETGLVGMYDAATGQLDFVAGGYGVNQLNQGTAVNAEMGVDARFGNTPQASKLVSGGRVLRHRRRHPQSGLAPGHPRRC